MSKSQLYVLLGPSAAGKSTLGHYLKTLGVPELVSHTTRAPRDGEINGADYFFVTREEFAYIPMIEETVYADNLYGSSVKEAETKMNSHDKCFVIADMEGVKQYKQLFGAERVKVIYIQVPLNLLTVRLTNDRGEEEAQKRLTHAVKTGEFDNWQYADKVILNIDLGKAMKELREWVGV